MPNWCANSVTVKHTDPKMLERVRTAFEAGRLCNEFLPNPTNEWSWEHSVNTWGTKWEVEGELSQEDESTLYLTFDSAWAPPIGLYEKLFTLGYEVYARYYEPGMAFAGQYEDGHDDCYDYSGMSSGEIAKYLPEEVDEYFGISETVAQWEDENTEEETVDSNDD
jgi:hypothetical protein